MSTELTEPALTYRCPKTDIRYTNTPWEKVSFEDNYGECDLCGSHGETTMYVECICGKSHKLVVSER